MFAKEEIYFKPALEGLNFSRHSLNQNRVYGFLFFREMQLVHQWGRLHDTHLTKPQYTRRANKI